MKRIRLVLCILTGWTGAAFCAAAGSEAVVLSEDGYFRQHFQFGLMRIAGDALRAEGDKLLGAGGLKRLERGTRQHLRDRRIDWTQADWRDQACVHFPRTQLGDDTRAVEMIRTTPPPAGWAEPDFDDASWLCQRIGRLPASRYSMESYDFSWHLIRAIRLRSYFHVADPARAGQLKLSIAFRGGARVLVNGKEVGRAFLPAGELSAQTPAQTYARQAYVVLPGEGPQPRGGCFADIRCEWAQAPLGTRRRREWKDYRLNAMGHGINQAGWNRLKGLRDRRLEGVTIPAALLKRGRNVLAVEIRGAHFHPQILPGAGGPRRENWAVGGGTDNNTWDHCRLLRVRLTASGGQIPSCIRRPEGVQLWADDMHRRLYSPDFNPPGAPAGKIRIVAAPNGTFSGLAVVGTDRALTGLTAAVTDLTGEPGRPPVPAKAINVSYLKGRSILELTNLGQGRCLGYYQWNCPMAVMAVSRYRVHLADPPADGRAKQAAWQKMMSRFHFFDHVAAAPPKTVPADTCQPVWISLKVPADAQAGLYRGTLTVSAEGARPARLPVEVEVVGWRVPDPLDFQSIVESEQSPYGVAKHYKVPLWSEEHWRLMGASFRQLGRLGADWLFVPVLADSEFGNRGDCSMIRWIRKSDDSVSFDYTVLDRYLDLAVRHWGVPRVICFQIMHGVGSATNHVKVLDEATGKERRVDVGPAAAETRRPLWRAFATALLAHMRARGLSQSVYWGHAFDRVYDPGLLKLMAEFAPGVHWAAGAHARKPDLTFRAVARTYGSDMTDRSFRGWKNPFIHLVMPRSNGSVICVEGTSTPFTYRVLCDRAIYCGFNGVGRMGADYFDRTWFDGFRGGEYLLVGRSCVQTLWPDRAAAPAAGKPAGPAPRGAESSARNEAMLEGLQEAEARIFLEQALDRKLLPADLAGQVQAVLDDHFRGTLHIPGGTAGLTMMDYTGDWQGRSRRLFATAARAAERIGVDVDRTDIGTETVETIFYGKRHRGRTRQGVPLPAMGAARVHVKVRNWTARPRQWRAATTQPWLRPAKAAGTLAGAETVAIRLDGKAFQAGQIVTGTVTFTEAASGRAHPVTITARVVKPVEMIVQKTAFNVTAGKTESRDYLLVNRTGEAQAWRIAASGAGLKADPAGGALAAGESTFVKVIAAPSGRSAARHEATLTLTALGGKVRDAFRFEVYVIPPYQPPAGPPKGTAVPLAQVSKDLLARHVSTNWFRANQAHRAPTISKTLNVWHGHKPLVIGPKTYEVGLWVLPPHETVYNVKGKGFTAFSAEVGWNAMVARNASAGRGSTTFRLSFEVFVDGKPVAHSGLMKATDGPRLIVARIPPGAGQLRLVTRATANLDLARSIAYANWARPLLYRPGGS